MSNEIATADVDAIKAESDAAETRKDPCLLAASFKDGWPSIAFFIVLAGGVYPTLLAAVSLAFSLIAGGPPHLVSIIEIFAAAITLGAVIGLLLATLASLIILPLAYIVAWSLKLRDKLVWYGAFCGGLVGFISVVGLMTQLHLFNELSDVPGMVLVLLIGPGLTTVLGQLGGGWGGWRAVRRRNWYEDALARARVSPSSPPIVPLCQSASGCTPATRPRLQFGIAHLLWIAVWMSLLLSVIRLSGIPFEFALPLLIGWTVYQAATVWIGGLLLRSWSAYRTSGR